jgi:hypothetical protein
MESDPVAAKATYLPEDYRVKRQSDCPAPWIRAHLLILQHERRIAALLALA